MSVINLFEHRNAERIEVDANVLEAFLDDVWKRRERAAWYGEVPQEPESDETQQFLQFLRRNGDVQVKSKKYVGVVRIAGHTINLLPKIFYNEKRADEEANVGAMHLHILWWLSYCGRIKFPNYRAAMGATEGSFLEVLMYMFAKYTRELLGNTVFQQYDEWSAETSFMKGRLNTTTYVREYLATGRWHKLHCTYERFDIDNEMNRIIKYVAKLLASTTMNDETRRYLQEILFILDDVGDEQVTAAQCASVRFNPMFGEYETVRDYCLLFLMNTVSIDYNNSLKLFAFLLPMEVVFEDFIAGFLKKELEESVVGRKNEMRIVTQTSRTQAGTVHLDENKSYDLRPDLQISTNNGRRIADTKYKMVYNEGTASKLRPSQSDLYQMLTYAVRFEVTDIVLIYPNSFAKEECLSEEYVIKDALARNMAVNVRVVQVPVVSEAVLCNEVGSGKMDEVFGDLRKKLLLVLEREFLDGTEEVQDLATHGVAP